jgi:hypothetical protein
MAEAVRSKKDKLLEDKIDQFCQNSEELLTSIHERCGDTAGGNSSKKGRRGRKKKAIKK